MTSTASGALVVHCSWEVLIRWPLVGPVVDWWMLVVEEIDNRSGNKRIEENVQEPEFGVVGDRGAA